MSAPTVLPVQHTAIAVIANLAPAARLTQAAAMNWAADVLALAGLRRRNPSATPHALGVALALQRIGRAHDRELATRLTKDTILTKLEWYAITPSDQQWVDVQTILRVQDEALDRTYLTTWAAQLGLTTLWAAAERGEQAPHQKAARPTTPDDDPRQTRMDF